MTTIVETTNRSTFDKTPEELVDYGFQWADWLDPDDTIASSAWTSTGSLTVTDDSIDDTIAKVWIGGGATGGLYYATNHIVTSGGRVQERTLTFNVAKYRGV